MQARQERQRSTCRTTSSVAGAPGFQHVLDQVDAPARAIELVAEQHEGRTGRGAEAAMHAGPQHLVGCGDVRVAQLFGGEVGLHFSLYAGVHAAWIEDALGVERRLHRPGDARERRRLLRDHGRPRRAGRRARAAASRCRRPPAPPRPRPRAPPRSPARRSRPARRPSRGTSARRTPRSPPARPPGPAEGRTETRQSAALPFAVAAAPRRAPRARAPGSSRHRGCAAARTLPASSRKPVGAVGDRAGEVLDPGQRRRRRDGRPAPAARGASAGSQAAAETP